MDFKRHIAENIAKGSSLCPFGSSAMGSALNPIKGQSNKGQASKALPDNFDLHGYDEDADDTDDEPLSDVEV